MDFFIKAVVVCVVIFAISFARIKELAFNSKAHQQVGNEIYFIKHQQLIV